MRKSKIASVLLLTMLSLNCWAKTARKVYLTENRTETILIGTEGTLLNFPAKPNEVVLGTKGVFSVKYVKDDLTISALSPGGRSNLFVYLDGRRFAFNLKAVVGGGDEIVLIRDPDEKKMKVKIRYE